MGLKVRKLAGPRPVPFDTPKENCVLTPRAAPTRESESFDPNRARGGGSIGIRNPTRAEQREHAPSVRCRKPHKTLGIIAKTPRGTLSAFSVNLAVGESSLTEFSSPGRTRTYDKAINSRLLYQLSYRGMVSGEFSGGGAFWSMSPFVLCQCLRREK